MSKKYDNDLNKIKYVVPTYATNGFDIDKENNIYKITTTFIAQFYDAKEKYLIDGLLKDIQENKERYKGLTIIPLEREKIVELLNKGKEFDQLKQQLVEKDKEIENLQFTQEQLIKSIIKSNENMHKLLEAFEGQIRHQVCEKVRKIVEDYCGNEENEYLDGYFEIETFHFLDMLDQIEKGE